MFALSRSTRKRNSPLTGIQKAFVTGDLERFVPRQDHVDERRHQMLDVVSDDQRNRLRCLGPVVGAVGIHQHLFVENDLAQEWKDVLRTFPENADHCRCELPYVMVVGAQCPSQPRHGARSGDVHEVEQVETELRRLEAEDVRAVGHRPAAGVLWDDGVGFFVRRRSKSRGPNRPGRASWSEHEAGVDYLMRVDHLVAS